MVFQGTDKLTGNREINSQTSVPEPSSEDNSFGYKGKLMDYCRIKHHKSNTIILLFVDLDKAVE